jgi:hypothetical protein
MKVLVDAVVSQKEFVSKKNQKDYFRQFVVSGDSVFLVFSEEKIQAGDVIEILISIESTFARVIK